MKSDEKNLFFFLQYKKSLYLCKQNYPNPMVLLRGKNLLFGFNCLIHRLLSQIQSPKGMRCLSLIV